MGLLAGVGYAMSNLADRKIAKYDAEDLAAQRQAAEIAKEKRMEEHAIRSEGRADARDTAKRGLMRAEAIAEEDRKYEPSYVQRELDRAEKAKLAGGETQRELDRLKLQNDTTPEALKAKRAEKLATDIDHGAGLRSIQIETARLSLEDKRKVNALMVEAETTKDPARRAEIIQSLTVRGIIKPGEFDTEKVTTETLNPDGSTSKTERTQKRQAGATAAGGGQPQIKYDKDGNAFVRGPNGEAVPYNPGKKPNVASDNEKAAEPAAKAKPQAAAVNSGPKENDTRQVAIGRSMGYKTQVYKRTGRSGTQYGWVDQ